MRSYTLSNPAFPSASPGTNVSTEAFSPLSFVIINAFVSPALPGCRDTEGAGVKLAQMGLSAVQESRGQELFNSGFSLVVQRLGLRTPSAGGPGSVPGRETGSCVPQLGVCMPQLEIPHATTGTRHSQINK